MGSSLQYWSRLLLAAVVYLTTTGFRPVGLSDGEPSPITVTPAAADRLVGPPPPTLSARAALLVDDLTGQPMLAIRAGDRLPPASITKLMTALLVAESGRYFDSITIQGADLIGGSTMGLVNGESLAARDLLDGLLLPSGNDAAMALARHFGNRLPGPGRPVARFVAQMNQRAADLGLTDTTFRNPSGLDEPGQVSSANDLARLTRVVMRQPVLAQIVAQPSVQVQGARRAYALRSTNQLLGHYAGTLGVKTGTTDAAGECLVALIERQGQRVIAVVLGSTDRYSDTMSLVDWGFDNFKWLEPPLAVVELAAKPGQQALLGPRPSILLPAGQVQFVEHRLLLAGTEPTNGSALETLVLGRRVAVQPVQIFVPGRTVRPQPGW